LLEDSVSVRQGKAARRKAGFARGLGLGLGLGKARHGGGLGASPAVGLGLRQGTEKKCGGWAVSREL
jgi:hypothetical protein